MPFDSKSKEWPIAVHLTLLAVFAVGMVGLWMLPVILAGYPFLISSILPEAREFAAIGLVPASSSRLSTLIVWMVGHRIGWDHAVLWTLLSALAMGAALIPWWLTVRKLFDVQTAWIATVVFALMPTYWLLALRLDGYSFAFFFLFCAFAFFAYLYPVHRITALVLSGLGFGAALGARDAFIAFIPWLLTAYLWHDRKRWLVASMEIAIFCAFAYGAFVAPLIPHAMQPNLSTLQRLEIFLPSLAHGTPGTGHLYPDNYTYQFLKSDVDLQIAEQTASASFIERQRDENYRVIFGIGEVSVLDRAINSVWLFINALPEYFSMEIIGGALLWIFILPGALVFRRRRPGLFAEIIGLWLSMEVILRFILRFHRSHLMDVGWALALFAALGVVSLADTARVRRTGLLAAGITFCIALQFVQVNRKQFAEFYRSSATPQIYAASEALRVIPEDAVVAHPRRRDLFSLVDHKKVTIHPDTLDLLRKRGEVAAPFRYYHVTHIIGYDAERTKQILGAAPWLKQIAIPEAALPEVTPLMQYILHTVR